MMVAIQGCEAHRERMQVQMRTWGKHPNLAVWPFTGKILQVPDDYEQLPLKHKAICRWFRKCEFIFKCDSDTYAHAERLRNSGFESHDYIGHANPDYPGCAFGGPGYWLSKKSLNILADAEWVPATGFDTYDDIQVGKILSAQGIKIHHDPRYSLYTPVLPDNDIITQHLSSREPFRIEMMQEAHKLAHA